MVEEVNPTQFVIGDNGEPVEMSKNNLLHSSSGFAVKHRFLIDYQTAHIAANTTTIKAP